MNVTVFGSGYVGLVTAAGFAQLGHHVVCVEIDASRVARLERGEVPWHEPGLEALLRKGQQAARLHFTTNAASGVRHGELLFVAVGTPPLPDGSAELRHVLDVADGIGRYMDARKVIVNKSTVPVGTAERVTEVIAAILQERGAMHRFSVLSNPEFLKEGSAVRDFLEPDRIVIGGDDAEAVNRLCEVYRPLGLPENRLQVISARDAEFTKYAANVMLATRISLMNEFANLAERLGVDIESVRKGIGSDPRIGPGFLHAGCGYGGSCFPKDVAALCRMSEDAGVMPLLISAVQKVNEGQKRRLFEKIAAHFDGDLRGRVVAVWGLAFKPGTDDMRDAPSRVLIEQLLQAGARVRAHDPVALDEARRLVGERAGLTFWNGALDAATGADVLALVTEWPEYREPDFSLLRSLLRDAYVFDGRNVLDREGAALAGVTVEAVGRPLIAEALMDMPAAVVGQRA